MFFLRLVFRTHFFPLLCSARMDLTRPRFFIVLFLLCEELQLNRLHSFFSSESHRCLFLLVPSCDFCLATSPLPMWAKLTDRLLFSPLFFAAVISKARLAHGGFFVQKLTIFGAPPPAIPRSDSGGSLFPRRPPPSEVSQRGHPPLLGIRDPVLFR